MDWIQRLRAQTRELHKTAQALPFFRALSEKTLPVESFVGQLRCLAVVHGCLEKQLTAHAAQEPFHRLLQGHRPKLPLLLQDLQSFPATSVLDILPAVNKALDTADQILTVSLEDRMALVGYLYTLEGSMMGGRVMAHKVRDAFPDLENPGMHFFTCYGENLPIHWSSFLDTLASSIPDPESQERIIRAAGDIFRSMIGIYEALYPFGAEQLGRHVVSLNPEAGRHSLPSNEDELQAALRAADRCWESFPYFGFRYGDRGRRFAASDTAWLASLCDVDLRALFDEVRWLAELLAVRGIPTWFTETQIRMLHEELSQARPEEHTRFDRLLLAADVLRHRRKAAPASDDIEARAKALREQFPVGEEAFWGPIFLTLAAAAADQDSGIPGGPEPILRWLRVTRSGEAQRVDDIEAFLNAASRRCNKGCQP